MLDRNRLINAVMRSFALVEALVGLSAKCRSNVGHQDLGVNLLLDGVGQFTGEALQVQAAFERFERFLNAPAGVVERCKVSRWVGGGVQQGRGQHFNATGREDYTYKAQAHQLAWPGFRAGLGRLGQRGAAKPVLDDLLGCAAANEFLDLRTGAAAAIHPGAKRDPSPPEKGEKPPSRIPSIQDQEITRGECAERAHQQAALAVRVTADLCVHHLVRFHRQQANHTRHYHRAVAVGAKPVGVLCLTPLRHAQTRAIRSHHPKTVPFVFAHRCQPFAHPHRAERCYSRRQEFLAGLRQRAFSDHAHQRGTIHQSREELIQPDLQRSAAHHLKQESNQNIRSQKAIAGEVAGLETVRCDKFRRPQKTPHVF